MMSHATRNDNRQNKVALRQTSSGAHDAKIQSYLTSRGWTAAERFLPKDDDELNDRLCRGEFTAVVFAVPEDALDMIWSGHGAVGRWHTPAGQLEVCFAVGTAAVDDWPAILRRTESSFLKWEQGRRHRQLVAGCILTGVALAAMGLLFWTRA